jgi:hypothetical protein
MHAQQLREVTQVFNLKPCSDGCLEGMHPCCIIVRSYDVIDIKRDHGENDASAEGVDARVRHALLPPLFDQHVPQ